MRDFFRYKRVGRQTGFTLFELMIVACVVAVMATILFNRVLFYQKIAEKTAMEQTVGILRSALHLQFASLITRKRVEDAQYLVGQNPMQWLAEKPDNYAGEYFGNTAESVVSGQWYFDLQDRNLVYLVHNYDDSDRTDQARPQVRFKVKLVFGVGDFPVKKDLLDAGKVVEGVVLDQTVPYSWN